MIDDRLKFRAWDKIKKEMFEVSMIDFCQKGYIWNETDNTSMETQNNLAYEVDNCVLMQCTGLRDKNGKLIFEGDILNFHGEHTLLVKWSETGGGWEHEQCGDFDDDGVGFGDFRLTNGISKNSLIIGNRFENPELLKGE